MSKFPVNNTLMSKFPVNNTLMSNIFAIAIWNVSNKIWFSLSNIAVFLQNLSLIIHTIRTEKYFYLSITESANDNQKLADCAYEDVDVKYIFLKGNVKKCSNYVWRKSFAAWIFAVNFAGIKFPNFAKKRKTSKFSTLENFWHGRIVLKIGLRNRNLGGLFRGSFCDSGSGG